jgi:hypothetical protein
LGGGKRESLDYNLERVVGEDFGYQNNQFLCQKVPYEKRS